MHWSGFWRRDRLAGYRLVEDLMLRMNTPETYDGWVNNTVKFNDPKVVSVIEEFGKFAKNDKYVSGGVPLWPLPISAIARRASSAFRPSATCTSGILHPTFFPEGTKLGTDADFFYMPPSPPSRNWARRFSVPARW